MFVSHAVCLTEKLRLTEQKKIEINKNCVFKFEEQKSQIYNLILVLFLLVAYNYLLLLLIAIFSNNKVFLICQFTFSLIT